MGQSDRFGRRDPCVLVRKRKSASLLVIGSELADFEGVNLANAVCSYS
jgi:hypothetical protein